MINQRNSNIQLEEPAPTLFLKSIDAVRFIGQTASGFIDARREVVAQEKRLYDMVEKSDDQGIKSLIAANVNPLAPTQANMDTPDAWLPLHKALAGKDERTALVLIDAMRRNHTLDTPEGQFGDTALMMCVKLGLRTAAHALVKAGADPGKPNHEGMTPFMEMCRRARTDMVTDALATLDKSRVALVIHRLDKGGFNSFFHSIASEAPGSVTKLLIGLHASYGFDTNGKYGPEGYAGIHVASLLGKTSTIRDLVDNYKADTNSLSNKDGLTPTMLAAWNNMPQSVKILASYPQTYLDGKRSLDDTAALHMSSVRGHREVTLALIECGANLQARNAHKQTPAELADYVGQREMGKLLRQLDPKSEANASLTDMLVSRAEQAMASLRAFARPSPPRI